MFAIEKQLVLSYTNYFKIVNLKVVYIIKTKYDKSFHSKTYSSKF